MRWVWLGLLVGCAPSTVTPEPPVVLAIDAGSPTTVREVAPETPAETPKPCEVSTDDLDRTGQSWDLILSSGDEPWGVLNPQSGGKATVVLDRARTDRVHHRFQGDGISLKGYVVTDTVELYAQRPMWFSEVMLVRSDHVLPWTEATSRGVMVELDMGTGFRPSKFVRKVRCGDIGLLADRYDEERVVGGLDGDDEQIVGDGSFALFAKEGSVRPALTMRRQDGLIVTIKKRGSDRHEVLIALGPVIIDAWVPKKRLAKLALGIGTGTGVGGLGLSGVGLGLRPPKRRDLACSVRLPFSARLKRRREAVGFVDAGRPFWVDDGVPVEKGWREIYLEETPIDLRGGAKLVVQEQYMADHCRELSKP